MANIKSSQKDIRRIEKRTVFNKRIKRRFIKTKTFRNRKHKTH